MNIIESLEWRYATKKFDSEKKLSDKQIADIKKALMLTPSSFGLQPWKFVLISDQETKNQLVEHSWGQEQVKDASHVLVLCRSEVSGETMVHNYLADMMEETWASESDLEWYKNMMLGFFKNMPSDFEKTWSDKQIYIALGNIMTVLAAMEIDACPMEWFISAKYDEILGLKDKDLASVLVLPIGFRSEEDSYAKRPKIRYDVNKLFIEV